MTEPKEISYYAVPDPDSGDMTYWRRDGHHRLIEWPNGVHYGPRLLKRDVPRELHGYARNEWVLRWYQDVRHPWVAKVHGLIEVGPNMAAARFAAFASTCCVCGRRLEDEASKVAGIGPVCGAGLSTSVIEDLARLVGRAHAEMLAGATS